MKLSKKTKQNIFKIAVVLAVVLIYLRFASDDEQELSLDSSYTPSVQSSSQITEFSMSENADEAASFDSIPEYSGISLIEINGNEPFFTGDEMSEAKSEGYFERYGELDSLGRCTAAYACLGQETMPASGEKRGDISEIHPSGWHQRKYDCVYQSTFMTRTHLIGWMLSAENDNEKNLISGTRYMNSDVMLEYEEMTQDYLYHNKGKHVLYRITPVFNGDELVARGILMEAKSVEDDGESICYCVYVYNVQPGLKINYENGWSDYTGIFFDINADSVITDNIELSDFIMDENNEIHSVNCAKCSEGTSFYGDIDMIYDWEGLGYDVCTCVYEQEGNLAA